MITEIDDLQSTNTNDVYLEGISNIPLIKGDKGNKGDKGDKGDIGPQGVQGPKGDKGDSYDDSEIKQDISDIEEELKQLQEDFYQSSIRGKVSGEYIHVEDSSGARCVIGIKGNHKQETRQGYNKLDESTLIDATAEGVNISYSNGKIKIEGTCTLATGQRLVTYIPITLEEGTYLFSCFGDYEYKYFTLRDNSNNYIQNLIQYNITGNQSREITVTETTTYRISIHILAGKVYNNEINLMISEGTEERNYEAFGVMPSLNYKSEIKTVGSNGCVKLTKCNKNMASLSDYEIGGFDMQTGQPKDGITAQIRTKIYHKVEPNTQYSISSKDVNQIVYLEYDENKNYIGFTGWVNGTNATFTTGVKTYFIKELIRNTNITMDNINKLTEIQLEKGTPTSYETHQEQSYIIPVQQSFKSIGDVRDTFIKKENKWYERHYVQRLILNGTESWSYDKNNNRFYFAKTGQKGYGYIMCSHYSKGDTTKQDNTCEIWTSAILFRNESITGLEDFKNMIKTKYDEGIPVYVDYVLITPTDIECTEEQSQILEELNNARTYKNVTNITTDSIAIIDLDYVKDLETLLNNMQALAVNNASEGV